MTEVGKNPQDKTGQSSVIYLMILVTRCSLLRFDGISVKFKTGHIWLNDKFWWVHISLLFVGSVSSLGALALSWPTFNWTMCSPTVSGQTTTMRTQMPFFENCGTCDTVIKKTNLSQIRQHGNVLIHFNSCPKMTFGPSQRLKKWKLKFPAPDNCDIN